MSKLVNAFAAIMLASSSPVIAEETEKKAADPYDQEAQAAHLYIQPRDGNHGTAITIPVKTVRDCFHLEDAYLLTGEHGVEYAKVGIVCRGKDNSILAGTQCKWETAAQNSVCRLRLY